MKVNIEQSTLNRALRLAARVTPTKPTLPILQMVLLEAEPGRLRLIATDGELGVTTTLAAEVGAPGRTAVPARLLGDYVAQLPSGPISLSLTAEKQRIRASSGHMVANLATMDPQDFPVFPAADEGNGFDLDAVKFRDAIERVVFAAARDEHRPTLTGVHFDFTAEGLTLAAADGFRLARVRLPDAAGAERQLLIPARAAAEFSRLLEAAETVRLVPTHDSRGMYLMTKDTSLYTRLIEGVFPKIDGVIPREWRTRVTVEKVEFRQAVRTAGLFGAGDARPVVLDAVTGVLRLHAHSDEVGEVHSELSASLEGEPQAVALNTRLLAEVLDAARSSLLELTWTNPQAPVVIREAGNPDGADLWVVMPLYDAALSQRQTQAA